MLVVVLFHGLDVTGESQSRDWFAKSRVRTRFVQTVFCFYLVKGHPVARILHKIG